MCQKKGLVTACHCICIAAVVSNTFQTVASKLDFSVFVISYHKGV